MRDDHFKENVADDIDLRPWSQPMVTLRLRDRERILIRKIQEALRQIDRSEYGICEKLRSRHLRKAPYGTPCGDLVHRLQDRSRAS